MHTSFVRKIHFKREVYSILQVAFQVSPKVSDPFLSTTTVYVTLPDLPWKFLENKDMWKIGQRFQFLKQQSSPRVPFSNCLRNLIKASHSKISLTHLFIFPCIQLINDYYLNNFYSPHTFIASIRLYMKLHIRSYCIESYLIFNSSPLK